MSKLKRVENSESLAYEAPKVTEETLDEGGNYVSPAPQNGSAPDRSSSAGTLGNSIIE
jgi:hypothetical protein